ncbi:Glyoxylate/hydroxypyruvate reductase B [Cedecea neteri]|uniref:Glyoxylate/hydroxypyruvate reductase B n=1 Tax=Cedecea neteri TaxID=158822 RepID=A0A2X2T2S8_9ENTR|nr:Glyoxylate/hydroxypyruvate reductase B [Cedecea neteri]
MFFEARKPLPLDSPLLGMPNVVALPHIGSATHETRYGMAECAVENLITALTGKVEVNCVNPQVAEIALSAGPENASPSNK